MCRVLCCNCEVCMQAHHPVTFTVWCAVGLAVFLIRRRRKRQKARAVLAALNGKEGSSRVDRLIEMQQSSSDSGRVLAMLGWRKPGGSDSGGAMLSTGWSTVDVKHDQAVSLHSSTNTFI